ncbi:MAG: Hpt domain-containing protein [Paracoccus sp. (in: a-proteobacteria)]|uniref:Hpt domain-containing protein n=1 Tax=Paracoccus sp. TaxID=267 RepID=UPI00391C4472
MIDWDRVHDMRAEVGDEEFGPLAEQFLTEIETRLMRLGRSPAQLFLDLHVLRGSALNMGFRELAALCLVGEANLRDGRYDLVGGGDLLACFIASRQAYRRHLAPVSGDQPDQNSGAA